MKEGWEYKTLGECCRISDFVSNGSFASLKQNVNYYYAKNYALLVRLADNSNNFDESKFVYTDKHGYDFTSKSHLHGGEIIMSNVGSVGSVFICPDLKIPMTLAPNTISIDTEYNRFFYYLFISPSFSSILSEIVTKTTLKKFNKTNFKKLIVRVPNSLDEQRRIVSYLDSSFTLIDEIKNKALKSLTEAKALFQSALAEAMEPKEGWEEKTLGEICLIVGRIGFRGYTRKDIVTNKKDGAITLSPSNIVNGNMCYNNCTYISWFKYNESPEIKIQNGDILIVKTGSSYGKSAFVENLPHKATINPQFVVLKDIKINHKFLSYQLKTKKTYDYINSIVSGSAIPTFSQANLSKMLTGLPPLPTQNSIVSRLDKFSSKVRDIEEKYQKMVEECDALKQAMLRDVFE